MRTLPMPTALGADPTHAITTASRLVPRLRALQVSQVELRRGASLVALGPAGLQPHALVRVGERGLESLESSVCDGPVRVEHVITTVEPAFTVPG